MKELSRNQMKYILGGVYDSGGDGSIYGCGASASCSDGTSISCSGYSVGNGGGCDATDAGYPGAPGGNGTVSCTEFKNDGSGGFIIKSYSC
jgi:hypothetical protein